MKKFRLFALLGLSLLIAGAQPLAAQSRKAKKEALVKEVKELLESGTYIIKVDKAYPMSGKAVHLTSYYALELTVDSVKSRLPYFGRAYSVPYGGGSGLHFDAPTLERHIAFDKKGNAEIRFNAKTPEDYFTFYLKVFTNGNTTIQVQPTNRQSISYNGELEKKK